MTVVVDLLARLGGADLDVTRRSPAAKGHFVRMALVLLSTATLAVVSMTFALTDALHVGIGVAVILALGWGFLILNLDCMLVQNLDPRGSPWRTLLMALPRIGIAMLIGLVVSTPLVLRVFAPEIRQEMVDHNTASATNWGTSFAASPNVTALDDVTRKIATDRDILKGNVPGITTPELADATATRQQAENDYRAKAKTAADSYAAWRCELTGDRCKAASGKTGNGPLAQSLAQQYRSDEQLAQQANRVLKTAVAAEAKAREDAKSQLAGKVAAEQQRARAELPGLEEKQKMLTAAVDAERAKGIDVHQENDGVLAQIEALNRLGSKDHTSRATHLAVAGLFFLIELLPVLVRVLTALGQESEYEVMRRLDSEGRLERARVDRLADRRRIEGESKRRAAVEDDMRRREEQLGYQANTHVAGEMQRILDLALQQWSDEVEQTLSAAPPAAARSTLPTSGQSAVTGPQRTTLALTAGATAAGQAAAGQAAAGQAAAGQPGATQPTAPQPTLPQPAGAGANGRHAQSAPSTFAPVGPVAVTGATPTDASNGSGGTGYPPAASPNWATFQPPATPPPVLPIATGSAAGAPLPTPSPGAGQTGPGTGRSGDEGQVQAGVDGTGNGHGLIDLEEAERQRVRAQFQLPDGDKL